MISDCTQASVFRVTGVNDVGAEIDLRRDENTGAGSVIFQNRHRGRACRRRTWRTGRRWNAQATVSRPETDIYYIAEGGTNNCGQRPLSLWRKSGSQAPVELVEGIEDLQVWLGIDTTPTDNVSAPADAVHELCRGGWRRGAHAACADHGEHGGRCGGGVERAGDAHVQSDDLAQESGIAMRRRTNPVPGSMKASGNSCSSV
ncbi:MAG: hypothetical protein R3E84_06115 [Pseudomonadales bacterium]